MDQILANLCVKYPGRHQRRGPYSDPDGQYFRGRRFLHPSSDGVPGDYVRLSVEDDGCGMDTEIREKLFEPFSPQAMGKAQDWGCP
ncbi:MAG: ATP-binding protein [Desulfobacterales bacterium]